MVCSRPEPSTQPLNGPPGEDAAGNRAWDCFACFQSPSSCGQGLSTGRRGLVNAPGDGMSVSPGRDILSRDWSGSPKMRDSMDRPKQPESMADFFDARSDGYDDHMRQSVSDFDAFYESIASPIPRTNRPIRVLDLGGGTGLELDSIFARAPCARITVIDLSAGMLARLRDRHDERLDQLTVVQRSYLEVPLQKSVYEYAIAVMTLHHLLPRRRSWLYRKIRTALQSGGTYIEGDWMVSSSEERAYLSRCREIGGTADTWADGRYHVDVPLATESVKDLLLEAGFSTVETVWRGEGTAVVAACH